MQFKRELRDRVRSGEVTCSVRIWQSPRVSVGKAYPLPPGYVIVDSIMEISLEDVTPEIARRSGFLGVVDLLKTAKHGRGERVFYITFHYVTGAKR
jgi:hypothetical protein